MAMSDADIDGFHRPHRPEVRFDAISEGWALFLRRWPTWVVAGLIVMVGNGFLIRALGGVLNLHLPQGGGGFRFQVPPAQGMVAATLVAVANGLFLGGMFRLACLQVRGHPIRVADLFGITDVLGELVIGSAIWGVAVTAAASFCVIPAFLLAGVWMFMIPLIVDGRLSAMEAISRSWHALKRQWLTATLFQIVAGFLAGLGACLCLGLFLSMPLYCLSITVLYRDFFLAGGAKGGDKAFGHDAG